MTTQSDCKATKQWLVFPLSDKPCQVCGAKPAAQFPYGVRCMECAASGKVERQKMNSRMTEMSDKPCKACGVTPAWEFPYGPFCPSCAEQGEHLAAQYVPKRRRKTREGEGEISEEGFQQRVIDYLRLRGYRVAHFRPGRTLHSWRTAVGADGMGWPDIVALKPDAVPALVILELKSDVAKPSWEQHVWLDAWANIFPPELGYMRLIRVLRPNDWDEFMRLME